MSNKVNGLWAVNSSSVFMFFDSVNSPSVWRFEMKDGVESWRMIPGVKNAQAVRGVAAAYRADGGTWLDPNGPDYAQAVSEIGDVPLIVERGDCMVSSDCGDYTAHGVSLSDADREHGWELSYEHGGMVVSRDISFLTRPSVTILRCARLTMICRLSPLNRRRLSLNRIRLRFLKFRRFRPRRRRR